MVRSPWLPFALAAFLIPAQVWAGPSFCEGAFFEARQTDLLRSAISGGFDQIVLSTTPTHPLKPGQISYTEFLEISHTLSPSARARLLEESNSSQRQLLTRGYIEAERAQKILAAKVALGSEEAWMDLVDRALSGRMSKDQLFLLLQGKRTLNPDSYARIQSKIFALYGNASKAGGGFSPRRAITLLIKGFGPTPEHLAERAHSVGAMKAYREHLNAIQRLRGPGLETSPELIMDLAKSIQMRMPAGKGEVFLAGSVVNGLAREGSDLDLVITRQHLESAGALHLDQELKKEIHTRLVRAGFRSHATDFSMENAASGFDPSTFEVERLGEIQSVMIRVTHDQVELWVYPLPRTWLRNGQLVQVHPAPARISP